MSQILFLFLFTRCILAHNECDLLKIIYEKLGGNVLDVPEDCCRMNGVTCTVNGHVTAISWSHQNLTGSIPPEIGMLANLQEL